MPHSSPTSIGVYRWDAYHGGTGLIYATALKCFAPVEYHEKIPFFGAIRPDGSITADDTDEPAKMEQQIRYAADGGVDYWIFLRYIDGDALHAPMNASYHAYQRSARKADLKFCWMLSHSLDTDSAAYWADEQQKTITAMQDPQWMRVLDGRPLVYVYQDSAKPTLPARLRELRALARTHGLPDPYVVAISFDPVAYGCDARTEWPRHGGQGDPAAAFTAVIADQNQQLTAGTSKAVLAAHVNWDSRPYHDNPPSWWKDPPFEWYRMPTSAEFRDRIQAIVNLSQANPKPCEINTLFVYAWNEFTEGGIMCPTRRLDGTIDTTILDGLRLVSKDPAKPRR